MEFFRRHTRVQSPYLCPELSLRLITPECPLWRADERDLQELGLADPFWGFCWAGGQALARYILDHPECIDRQTLILMGDPGRGHIECGRWRQLEKYAAPADVDMDGSHLRDTVVCMIS